MFFHCPSQQARPLIAALELKGGGFDAVKVARQLEGAASIVAKEIVHTVELDFVPVLLHRGISAMEVNRLRSTHVRFRGERYKIDLERCGIALASIRA